MYDLPGRDDIDKVTITEEVVNEGVLPTIMGGGKKIDRESRAAS